PSFYTVRLTEDKINAFIKAASVNVDSFWLGWVAHALASVNTGSLICHVGGPAPSTTAVPAGEKNTEVKKEEPQESDDDMGFGLFD
ncbi:hypothetical protein Celaphus_00017620, partial [Cervus elaphus hippelaphus]